ncbi:MAG TPA: ribosome silencing factor, partial [Steroidobacteraceae bacterium]
VPMTDLSPRAMADVVVDAAGDKKAEDILVLNVSELTTIADLFVICTGRGERQVQAIADAVREKAIEAGRKPIGVEGYSSGRWVLIDLGDVVVHAFVPEERQLYRLERLWGDAPRCNAVLPLEQGNAATSRARPSRAARAR